MTSRTGSARRILGDFEKDGWLSLTRGGIGQVSHEMGGGADEKPSIERLYLSLSLCRRTFRVQGNKKSFVPELRSRKCFSCFEIPMFYLCGHSKYVSHIAISWLWYRFI